jgi:hypothetical protein
MASNYFRGDAQDVAQVTTLTIGGTAANGQVYTVTANRKEISYTADGSDTNTTIAESLLELLTASSIPEFQLATFTQSGAVITATASTAGRPFVFTSGATGTGTFVTATTTASKGHWHWDDPDNWSAGTIPAATEDIFIENVSTDILYGIDQNGVALATLNIGASFTGKIGLKDQAAEGYTEYLEKSLKIRPGTLNIGYGVGPCSQFIRIDTGTAAAVTINVFGTGSPTDQISKALMLQGSHASNVLNTTQGSIGCAMYAGETSNFPTVRVGSESQPATDVDIFGGTGASWTTITQIGGNVEVNSNVTTWTKYGGTSANYRTSTIGTITQEGQGSHSWQSTGTITTGTFRGAGSYLDSSRDIRGKTITNATFIGGAYFIDPSKSMTFTNPFTTDAASLLAIAQKNGLGSGQFNLQRS